MKASPFGFGTYYPAHSMIHQLDPRVKFLAVILLMTSIFTTTHIGLYALIGLVLYLMFHLAQVRFVWMHVVKSIWLLLFIMILMNSALTPGTPLFPQFEFLSLTREGLIRGVTFGFRLLLTVMITSLLTVTTSPFLLTDGIKVLFKPLEKIGIPVAEIAFIIQLAYRFIPTFVRERDKMLKAQAARGHLVASKGFVQKASSMIVIVTPLLMSAFRRVDELSAAMDVRMYQVRGKRTSFKEMRLKGCDYQAMGAQILFVVGIAILDVFILT